MDHLIPLGLPSKLSNFTDAPENTAVFVQKLPALRLAQRRLDHRIKKLLQLELQPEKPLAPANILGGAG